MRSKGPPNFSFQTVGKRSVFRGRLIHLDLLKIRTSGGLEVERELIRHPGASVMIPELPDGRLVLIRQLRVSTGKSIWEFPAGTLERGESPRACALREIQEETGWKAGRLRKVLEFFPTPGISTEKMHLFVADHLERVEGVRRDLDEELVVRSFTPSQVERMIRSGEIVDGKTILAFLFFQRYFLSFQRTHRRRRSSVGRAAVS